MPPSAARAARPCDRWRCIPSCPRSRWPSGSWTATWPSTRRWQGGSHERRRGLRGSAVPGHHLQRHGCDAGSGRGAHGRACPVHTRLDLEAVVMSPVGDDLRGRLLSGLLAEQGIGWVGPRADATAVSAILPLDGDRAFVTVAPDLPRDGEAIAALE